MPRASLAVALGPLLLLACATSHAPTAASGPPPLISPEDQPSDVQHPDTPSGKRGVIVPSDVSTSGREPPVPEMTPTASPAAAPPTGGGN